MQRNIATYTERVLKKGPNSPVNMGIIDPLGGGDTMPMRRTIELITNSSGRYITPSGLSVVGIMLSRSEFVQYCNQRHDLPKRSEPQIPNGDIMLTMTGLLVQGKPQFDSVNDMKIDPEYHRVTLALKRGIPSSETLRQRLDATGKALRKAILSANVKRFNIVNQKRRKIS